MTPNELLIFTENKVAELFKGFPVPAHGLDHVQRVRGWIVLIARAENVSLFLAELTALLHDIGRVAEFKDNPQKLRHQELSYILAQQWFTEYREFDILSTEEKEEILYAIRYHWDDTAEEYSLANILRDADKLDMFGEVGVKRACDFYHTKEEQLENVKLNLTRVERIKTAVAKKIIKERKLLDPINNFLKQKSMKILIIGAKGMLGQELVSEFSNNNYEVLAWDREDIDITDQAQVLEKVKNAQPEIIINAAAYNAVDKIEQGEQEFANKINGYAVRYLAEAAAELGAILVHYSTDFVFEGDKVEGYKEDDAPNPQSAYAKSKLLGEEQLTHYTLPVTHYDLKYYLIRTSRLFGKAAASEGAKKSFVDVMLDLSKTKDSLELVDEEIGSPTYVKDLARRTREIIEGKNSYGIYHVTNSGACSWYGWGKKIFELAGKDMKLTPVSADKFPRPAPRPKYSILLNTKLSATRSWEEALADYLSDIKNG